MVIESITKVDVLIGLAINGIFTGVGTAIGSYLATKHVTERLERAVNKLKEISKKNGKKEDIRHWMK